LDKNRIASVFEAGCVDKIAKNKEACFTLKKAHLQGVNRCLKIKLCSIWSKPMTPVCKKEAVLLPNGLSDYC
jgi:hypothetical protein